jgi:hypothetical protein
MLQRNYEFHENHCNENRTLGEVVNEASHVLYAFVVRFVENLLQETPKK